VSRRASHRRQPAEQSSAPGAAADGAAAHVLDGLRRVLRVLRVSSRQAEQLLGVSGAQLFVLQQLERAPAYSLNELADRTRTDQSSVSVVVSRLVDRGLVSRVSAEEDARRVTLRLTAAGRALVRRAPRAGQERLTGALAEMPRQELATLARVLATLCRALDASESDGVGRGTARARAAR
jgi:DNA-binding MarR family transcriptional regulator